jgi:hypothetical protein
MMQLPVVDKNHESIILYFSFFLHLVMNYFHHEVLKIVKYIK